MKKTKEELYWEAKRFDEGHLCQNEVCIQVTLKMTYLQMEMAEKFGPEFEELMEEYCKAASMERELENRHYFNEGYRVAQTYMEQ